MNCQTAGMESGERRRQTPTLPRASARFLGQRAAMKSVRPALRGEAAAIAATAAHFQADGMPVPD